MDCLEFEVKTDTLDLEMEEGVGACHILEK